VVGLEKRFGNEKQGQLELFRKAFALAEKKLPEYFVKHSLNVSRILSEHGFDNVTVIAGLAHDLCTKGDMAREEVAEELGSEIGSIVSEFAKIDRVENENTGKISNEMLSTIILASATDLRTIFIKIVARIEHLDNPAGLEKWLLVKLSNESLYIYAPICQKLGLYELQALLEDRGLKVTQPRVFEKIRKLIGKSRAERQAEVEDAIAEFSGLFEKNGKKVTVHGRAKSFYSIFEKMQMQRIGFGEVFDRIGVRAICDSVQECYEVLGIVHSKFKTVPNQFDDYIANPKKNGYKCIHTVVLWNGKPLEVQIRTWEMHYEDETGIASHWQYKNYAEDKFFDHRLKLAKQLVDWHREARSTGGLAHSLKIDFGQNRVFVFTPENKIVVLPESSTPIDFAFAIHSDLGSRCNKAKVNGKIVPLSHSLENADIVEVMTSKQSQVKRQWLSFIKSHKAQAKIRQLLGIKPLKKKALIELGKESLTSDENTRIAKCCNPVPGDEIVGVRTTKRKISVHRENCRNIAKIAAARKIKIKWGLAEKDYVVSLRVKARDRPGLLPAILKIINEKDTSITSTNAKTGRSKIMQCDFNVRIKNLGQVGKMIKKINELPGVFEASRG
jgi:GTP pyrophosphokinase